MYAYTSLSRELVDNDERVDEKSEENFINGLSDETKIYQSSILYL